MPRRSFTFPIVIILLPAALAAWLLATDHVARSLGVVLLSLLVVLLLCLWWALGARGRRLKRLALVLLAGAALWGAGRLLLRYEGSADGTAMPRFAWRWTVSASAAPAPQAKAAGLDLAEIPAGLADMRAFMGASGDGIFPAPAWKTDWAAHPPREAWRQAAGKGWSGFAVAGRRAVTQEQRDSDECVNCYDIVTGALLWSHTDEALFSEPLGGDGPRATPAISADGARVYTLGGTGILNCLDLATGARLWRRDILAETKTGNLMYGKSGSPLLHGARVIVTGGNGAPTLLAYDARTGEPSWQAGGEAASYSTPALRTLAGREQIVSVNAASVTGHDTATGTVLWRHPWPGDYPKVGQPAQAGPDRILVTSSYGQKSHLLEIRASGGGFESALVWSASAPRTKFSSATVLDGRAYALDEGTLVAVDLESGERLWRRGRYGFGQHLQLGGLLLIQTEPGPVVLVRPGADGPEEIARLPALSSKTWNPPALAGRWLLLRNDREMVCYELAE
ncbi:MAG TPA: PQQ-like beta-propeller repeat protein [Prosthecobacter sp.]|nr:PQQ-like beta-propeller repeat protein [Prosthecobacter sp.]